jgi:hypothetical protein
MQVSVCKDGILTTAGLIAVVTAVVSEVTFLGLAVTVSVGTGQFVWSTDARHSGRRSRDPRDLICNVTLSKYQELTKI